MTPEVVDVAGFWTEAQRVPATLEVASGAAVDLALTLDALASDADWTLELPSEAQAVPAGTVIVPVTIVVPPDAATDVPVTVTVRARDETDAQATASTDVTPGLGADPVGPTTTWPLPDALLGGLDVASTALGGALVTPADPAGEALLHDGLALSGTGFVGIFRGAPFTLTVDLAGDAPVPVAGFILDPLGGDGALSTKPRHVELQLSPDGTTFETVAVLELSARPVEQAVVLDTPVEAAFARLLLHSSYSGTAGAVSLGEWKVVASPASRRTPSAWTSPIRPSAATSHG